MRELKHPKEFIISTSSALCHLVRGRVESVTCRTIIIIARPFQMADCTDQPKILQEVKVPAVLRVQCIITSIYFDRAREHISINLSFFTQIGGRVLHHYFRTNDVVGLFLRMRSAIQNGYGPDNRVADRRSGATKLMVRTKLWSHLSVWTMLVFGLAYLPYFRLFALVHILNWGSFSTYSPRPFVERKVFTSIRINSELELKWKFWKIIQYFNVFYFL